MIGAGVIFVLIGLLAVSAVGLALLIGVLAGALVVLVDTTRFAWRAAGHHHPLGDRRASASGDWSER